MTGVERRMALAQEWDEAVVRVRELPGLAGFLRPPPLSELLPGAGEGTVVVLTSTRWGGAALLAGPGGVDRIELPELTAAAVAERVTGYLAVAGARRRRDAGPADGTDDAEPELAGCLTWMWDTFAERILGALGFDGPPPDADWPRLWWCPAGPLSLLPLHAAGRHDRPGASVIDRVVSSYTPTLRALRQARRASVAEGPMLFVGMPETGGLPSLPSVVTEQEVLARRFGGRLTSLVGAEATPDAVLAALGKSAWAHFACHGAQDLANPSEGALHVHEGRVTVADLGALEHRGEFAYLSGCETAVGGSALPDEAITLAAALHYTGYRHVIATLRSVGDAHAAEVAADVYGVLTAGGHPDAGRAAEALHLAVRALRERAGPGAWTPYIHLGP